MAQQMRVAVLGASGAVGRRVVERLLARGHAVSAQSRSAGRLGFLEGRGAAHVFDPRGSEGYAAFLKKADAALFALGTDARGKTTLFSEATGALLVAMAAAGVPRLVAITGVGAGETRGHGGFLYDRVIFPLFTRQRYADKDRQEAMIAQSGLDWTIVRPAPFSDTRRPGALTVLTDIPRDAKLTAITRDEVADFVVDELETGRHIGTRPFIGHP
jgi:putative NADH-flavin reductase